MSTSEASFKPPPVVECVSREVCLGIGKKIYSAEKVCSECLRCHDPEQLRCLADGNDQALAAIAEEVSWKQQIKANLESHDRFLCAFEDPDYELCRWRQKDLNLRGNRTNCSIVKRKGTACSKCWTHHLERIGIIQYFTATGLCHEEADKVAHEAEVLHSPIITSNGKEDKEDEEDDDVEGYDVPLY